MISLSLSPLSPSSSHSRLSYMHEILEDFNVHLRVVNAGDVVPLLLK